MKEGKKKELEKIFDKFLKKNKEIEFIENIGVGAFGLVNKLKIKGKIYAGKLVYREKNNINEADKIIEFKGPNIVKVNKIYQEKINNKNYDLIIMEKSNLRDLTNYCENNIFKSNLNLIYMSPTENAIGDNLLRFFA